MHLCPTARSLDSHVHCRQSQQLKLQLTCRAVHRCAATDDSLAQCDQISRRATVLGAALACAPAFVSDASAAPPLSIEEVQERLIKCFEDGQYYVSGSLDRGIFEDGCVFTDPTINVTGTEKYASAVATIFSPETARADLITCSVTGPRTIELTWRLEGVISQAGFDFSFKPYTGRTVYTLSPDTGKVARQDETWDISQLDVFVGLFFPQFGAPAAPPADVLRQRAAGA